MGVTEASTFRAERTPVKRDCRIARRGHAQRLMTLEWMWSPPGFPASTVPGRENRGWGSAVSATGRRASLGPTMISDRSPVQLQLQQASGDTDSGHRAITSGAARGALAIPPSGG